MKHEKHQDDGDGGAQLVDGTYHGDGQVLHGGVAEHPGAEDEGGLAKDEEVLARREGLDVELLHEVASEDIGLGLREHHKRQENQPTNQGAEEQHGDDGVADYGLFLEDIVEAEQHG